MRSRRLIISFARPIAPSKVSATSLPRTVVRCQLSDTSALCPAQLATTDALTPNEARLTLSRRACIAAAVVSRPVLC